MPFSPYENLHTQRQDNHDTRVYSGIDKQTLKKVIGRVVKWGDVNCKLNTGRTIHYVKTESLELIK